MKTITYINDVTKTDTVLTDPYFVYDCGFPCVVGNDSEGNEVWLDIRSEAEFLQGLEEGIIRAPISL